MKLAKSGESLARVWKWGLLFLSLYACFSVGATRAGAAQKFDPEKFIVDGGLLFTVDAKGEKTRFEGVEVVETVLEGERNSKRYWLIADPEAYVSEEGLYEGWKSGIYFFGGDGKFISCLETEDAPWSEVKFSPDGKLFVLDSGTGVVRDFALYAFDGLQLISTLSGISPVDWLDNERFAFTGLDDSHGPRGTAAEVEDWMSVVIYERDMAGPVTVKAATATATEDYVLGSVDRAAGELEIWKTSVKNAKDWPVSDKREQTTIRVPIPAVGQR
jgi:WD40 repeat protein